MKKILWLGLLTAAITFAGRANAVVMTPMNIEEMTAHAHLIVQGTVLSKTCQRDAVGRIFTRIELQVSEIWKGTATGPMLNLVHGGGTLGEERSRVSGQVEYQVGEEVVGFFVLNQRGEAVTIGLAQGKFHIWKEARTGEKLATNPFHGPEQLAANAAGLASAIAAERFTLARLKQRVQGSLR